MLEIALSFLIIFVILMEKSKSSMMEQVCPYQIGLKIICARDFKL